MRYRVSDHCDGERFFNPGVETDRGLRDLWLWRRQRRPAPWPDRLADRPATVPPRPAPGEGALTFVGHSTVLVRTASCTLITDPMFSERASPLAFAGPRRVRAPALRLQDLPPLDAVLLSHNHYDHLDLPSLKALERTSRPLVVTGLGVGQVLRRAGIERVVELDWWQEAPPLPGTDTSIAFVPAQHWSSRTPFDRRRTLWGGHLVRSAGTTLLFAGDTGYGPHFGEIARKHEIDVALLPIGAYEPRWFMGPQHMDPADAVQAHLDLRAKASFGIHWGTFQLTDEAIGAPVEGLEAARAGCGLPPSAFQAPEAGDTVLWAPDIRGR